MWATGQNCSVDWKETEKHMHTIQFNGLEANLEQG